MEQLHRILRAQQPAASSGDDPGVEHARIPVRLIARARVNKIAGEREGALLVRVTAPPVDGQANAALCELIAKHLGIAARRVSVVRGLTSRQKVVQVEGLSARELARALTKREP